MVDPVDNILGRTGGHTVQTQQAVYRALQELGGWRTHLEVRDYGRAYISAPQTEIKYGVTKRELRGHTYHSTWSRGGWCVWDFPDRVKRALETLHKQGYVGKQNGKYMAK